MSKSNEELATEITIAWVQAIGQACSTGKFHGDWLKQDSIANCYKEIFNTLIEASKDAYSSTK